MADAPRLYLITPPVADAAAFAPLLETAVGAADIACVLIRIAARDDHGAKAAVRALAPIVQARGAAALVEDRRLAVRLDLDGVHVVGDGETLDDALKSLKPDRIVGVGGLHGRDAAMRAGEAGVDYLMFGAPDEHAAVDRVREDVEWWSQIFTVPCIGYAARPEAAAAIAAAGAEFVALCDGLWDDPAAIGTMLEGVSTAISRVLEGAS